MPRNVINALLIQYLAPCVSRAGIKRGKKTRGKDESENKMFENHQRVSRVSCFALECVSAMNIPDSLLPGIQREATRYTRARERALAQFGDFAPIRQWIILYFVLYRVRRTRKLAHRQQGRLTLIRKILSLSLNRIWQRACANYYRRSNKKKAIYKAIYSCRIRCKNQL